MFEQKKPSVVIITGGGKRIGFNLAKYFAKQNENVLISYRTYYPAISELCNLGVIAVAADFSKNNGITSFLQEISKHCSSIKLIIHNASEWKTEQADDDFDNHADLFDAMMQIHAKTPYLLNLYAFDLLKKYTQLNNVPASIIHLSDYIAEKGSDKHIAYAASKRAMENLTLSFAKKFAPLTRVNAIAPALIAFNDTDNLSYQQSAIAKSLMQTCGGYDEITIAVEYLLKSHYVTGQILSVNGGRNLK